jgi:cytochrome c oxidase subunit 2
VPKLAGKTDAIPGRTNHMWLNATETGEFHGQCAEFCGLGHAGMRFTVCVQSQRNFDTWLEEQKNPPAAGQEDPGAATCT